MRYFQISLIALLILILVVVPLAGCTSNRAEVEQLQSRIAQLEQENTALKEQLAEKEAGQDKNEAIAQFAWEALGLQRVLLNNARKWTTWQQQNLLEMSPDNYPRYKTLSKEAEARDKVVELLKEVGSTITAIELLYAPPEALKAKRKLLAEGDSLVQAFVDIITYYANAPDIVPLTVYQEAQHFITVSMADIDKDIRRELTDLFLEYGQ